MIGNIYFIGIGGIGMSALARYFLHEGMHVAGYDLTETPLTRALAVEGAKIHYSDEVSLIPGSFRDPASTMVVYTPAVPRDHRELAWFRREGFMIEKRSEMLGHIAEGKFTMAVAGTHGKTTTTTLVAWLNHVVTDGGSAFLGGISKNFDSNLVLGCSKDKLTDRDPIVPRSGARDKSREVTHRPLLAVEADEFDRSFLRLSPDAAVITSVDPDHLDIYGTYEAMKDAFVQFTDRIKPGGALILNRRANIEIRNSSITTYTYSLDNVHTDFHAANLHPSEGGRYGYDIVTPDGTIKDVTLGITGRINVENSIAAVALAWATARMRDEDFDHDRVRTALAGFRGVKRRFDFHVNTPSAVYMDDYAHHPEELAAALSSLREAFPGRKITAIFQPHLYTRTRDLYKEFAAALSKANELILTPIYPARELPIEGVSSELIGGSVTIPWRVVPKEELAAAIAETPTDVVVTFGAGNIENHCASIAAAIEAKTKIPTDKKAGTR